MTWTRLIQCGFEFRDLNELESNTSYGFTTGLVSTTEHYYGSASFDAGGGAYARGKGIAGTSTLSIRSSAFLKTTGTGSADEGVIFAVVGDKDIIATYDTDDNAVRLRIDDTQVDTIALNTTDFATVDTWHNVSIYCYANSSSGRIAFFVNGSLVLEYDGDTGTYINGVYVGGDYTVTAWHTNTFIDDFYADYSTTQETDSPPPTLVFPAIKPTSDGSPINWNTFGSANHYANIDDTTPNGDTDYNYTTSASQVDTYGLADYTVPSGFSIAAVIPTVYAKKTDGATSPTLDIGLNENSIDSYGSSQTLGTTYGYYNSRFTVAPDTDSWDDTNIDATSLKLRSSGTF